jgi:hypothetical protein
MWTAKWILDDYEAGNEAVRLEMYMAYPDLRRYFEEFEARPTNPVVQKADPASEKPAGVWWNHCCRLVRG